MGCVKPNFPENCANFSYWRRLRHSRPVNTMCFRRKGLLYSTMPARRIGLRWGATRAPRREDDGGAERYRLCLCSYSAPLESSKAINPNGPSLGSPPGPSSSSLVLPSSRWGVVLSFPLVSFARSHVCRLPAGVGSFWPVFLRVGCKALYYLLSVSIQRSITRCCMRHEACLTG
jgi:hypothetical protein